MKLSRFLIALILIALFTVMATMAFADPVTFTYQPPTEYADNSPLLLEELDRYELGCSQLTGDYSSDIRTWIGTETQPRTEQFIIPGNHFCALRVICIGADCDWSDWSNEVNFSIGRKAKPPVIVTVTVGGTG